MVLWSYKNYLAPYLVLCPTDVAWDFPNVVMRGPLQKTLDVVLDPKGEGTRVVEFTDRLALLGILRDNRWARDMVWPYFRDNWDALYKKYGSG